MLMSTALGVPRFSIMSDRRSSSTRFSSFPKFARARRAETTIVPFLPVVVEVVDINSPFQLHELYSFQEGQSMTLKRPRIPMPLPFSGKKLRRYQSSHRNWKGGSCLLTRVPCGSGNRRRGTTVKVSGQARWAKSSEYITQVSAIGPLGLEYLNAKDDPRNNHS